MEIKKNNYYTGRVSDLTHLGQGVVKIGRYPFFVEGSLVGEEIEFKAVKVNKKFGFAKLIKILSPSPARVDLGENAWAKSQLMALAHLSYSGQVEFKKKLVYDNLTRLGHFSDITVSDTQVSPKTIHYRNKALVPVKEKDGKLITGFYRPRSHDLISQDNLYLNMEDIDRLVIEIRKILNSYKIPAYDEKTGQGTIRHIGVRMGVNSDEAMVILVTNGEKLDHRDKIVADIVSLSKTIDNTITYIVQNINDQDTNVIMGRKNINLYGPGYYMDKMLGLDFKISPSSFFQINTKLAEKLYSHAIKEAEIKDTDIVLDAYCGIGTISLNIAKKAGKVYGIELVEEAVAMAKENAKINNIENADFIAGQAEKVLADLKSRGINFDIVFVDPPRKGLDKTFIETLIAMNIEKIVYISCNPATQARDCRLLADNGYKINSVKPFDMFPQTPHVETIALIQKI